MIFIEIHGVWNGRAISDNASVTTLAADLEDQQKQITTLALQFVSDTSSCSIEQLETAADFARRAGFTRLDYCYQINGTSIIVDILQPSSSLSAPGALPAASPPLP